MIVSDEFKNERDSGSGMSRNEKIALIVFFVLALGYTSFQFLKQAPKSDGIHLGNDIAIEHPTIVVDVSGAVVKPGIYFLPEGSRVIDAIQAAGGFSETADKNSVNSAKVLVDQEKIIVKEINSESQWNNWNENTNQIGRMDPGGATSQTKLVNLNTATKEELMTVQGIGEKRAQNIIDYRNKYGGFKSVDELELVPLFGPMIVNRIRHLLTVEE